MVAICKGTDVFLCCIDIPKADKTRASNHNPFEEDGFVCMYYLGRSMIKHCTDNKRMYM